MCLVPQSYLTLCDSLDCSLPGSSVHGDSPGKNIEVGCHILLQEISPTQGLNSSIPHYRGILNHLGHQGSPNIFLRQGPQVTRGSNPGLTLQVDSLPSIPGLFSFLLKYCIPSCLKASQRCFPGSLCPPPNSFALLTFIHGVLVQRMLLHLTFPDPSDHIRSGQKQL